MTTLERWRLHWQDKTSPHFRSDSEEYFRLYAQELKILFGEETPSRVLEIGCGNGAMYQLLGFNHTKYKGVDLSPAMLDEFKKRHGAAVDVICSDASTYRDDNTYDLIFSNSVVQYFDKTMLDNHIRNARGMMHPKSRLVCASVLWKRMQFAYLRGDVPGTKKRSSLVAGVIALKRFFSSPIGFWHDLKDFEALGRKYGMKVEFHGTLMYLYRFHVVMTPL